VSTAPAPEAAPQTEAEGQTEAAPQTEAEGETEAEGQTEVPAGGNVMKPQPQGGAYSFDSSRLQLGR
jgi:hypothetical protein